MRMRTLLVPVAAAATLFVAACTGAPGPEATPTPTPTPTATPAPTTTPDPGTGGEPAPEQPDGSGGVGAEDG